MTKHKKLIVVLACIIVSSAYSLDFNLDDIESSAAIPQTQYIFFFRGSPLPNELKTFAKNNNFDIIISPLVINSLKKKKITGKFSAKDLKSFLSLLGRQYGFKWFLYANTLYITSSNVASMTLNVPSESFADIRNYLINVGLMVPEFGYTELANQNKIIISGPIEYLNLVKSNVDALHINNAHQQFAIYRLKYANAADTTLSFNNQTINIPGVASLLSGLINHNIHHDDFSTNVNEMIKNRSESSSQGSSDSQVKNFAGSPQIEADPRLNTIIVRDNVENLKMYKNIIKSLDIPAPLIQIDVLIIRLDQDKLAQNGINWWASKNNAAAGFGTQNLSNPTNNLMASYNQVNPGQLIVTNIASFSSSLQFLEDNQYAKTQAKPSLATIDNLPAVTTTIENIFSANTNAAVTNNVPQNANNNFGYTGIQLIQGLQITPHVIVDDKGNKKIRLSIVLQDGSIDDFSNPMMPNYSQGYLNSQTIIDEGQSVILAGYTKSSNVVNQSQVPILGDIPFLGWLFKTKSSSIHRITTLYVVTPKIILNNFYTASTMGVSTDVKKLNSNLNENTASDTTKVTKLPMPQDTNNTNQISKAKSSNESVQAELLDNLN